MKALTKELALKADVFYHVELKNKSDNTPLRVRRNGKTQTWKTRPDEFRVPVKYGLYAYANITNDNMNEWQVNDDLA